MPAGYGEEAGTGEGRVKHRDVPFRFIAGFQGRKNKAWYFADPVLYCLSGVGYDTDDEEELNGRPCCFEIL